MKKLLDDYNPYNWTEYEVGKPEKAPTGPHFAAILFEKETRHDYDPYNGNQSNSHQVDTIKYFAFPDKETLSEWVLRAAKDKKKFFFFEVKKLGSAQLKVSVDLGV